MSKLMSAIPIIFNANVSFSDRKQVSANRNATLKEAASAIWARGPIKGSYQGLLPWVCNHPKLNAVIADALTKAGRH